MKKVSRTKLQLSTEAIRRLQASKLALVIGGAPYSKPINCGTTIWPSCTPCGATVDFCTGAC